MKVVGDECLEGELLQLNLRFSIIKIEVSSFIIRFNFFELILRKLLYDTIVLPFFEFYYFGISFPSAEVLDTSIR